MKTPRAAIEHPNASSLFLSFAAASPHSPRCDATFSPPRCSNLFHDQVQTPHYPNNSKYDGTCSSPCVCGGPDTPCGEYLWDHRNAAVRDYIVNEYMLGDGGLGSGFIDGFSLDDGWSNHTNVGSNACDGSPVGGPSEVDSYCATDMGLTQQDTIELTRAWSETIDAIYAAVNARGGFLWPQFVHVATPPQNVSQCTAFFNAACSTAGQFLNQPILHLYTEAPGRVFDPLPAFEQDLAAFLLIRGAYGWLGYDWNGCSFGEHPPGGRNNQSWAFPSALDADVGVPLGECAESAPGIFTRKWSRANVTFNCHLWQGHVSV